MMKIVMKIVAARSVQRVGERSSRPMTSCFWMRWSSTATRIASPSGATPFRGSVFNLAFGAGSHTLALVMTNLPPALVDPFATLGAYRLRKIVCLNLRASRGAGWPR